MFKILALLDHPKKNHTEILYRFHTCSWFQLFSRPVSGLKRFLTIPRPIWPTAHLAHGLSGPRRIWPTAYLAHGLAGGGVGKEPPPPPKTADPEALGERKRRGGKDKGSRIKISSHLPRLRPQGVGGFNAKSPTLHKFEQG